MQKHGGEVNYNSQGAFQQQHLNSEFTISTCAAIDYYYVYFPHQFGFNDQSVAIKRG